MLTVAPPTPAAPPAAPAAACRRGGREAVMNTAGYAAAAFLALASAVAVLQLWRADLRVPLFYGGDNLMGQLFVQNVLDTGSVFDNPRLSAPAVLDMRDYPIPDILHTSIIWALGCCFPDSAVVLNLSYLLAFPLTGLSAYFALRRLRLGRLAALVPAVLYACLPYHFLRIHGHLFLSSYYRAAPMVWIALRVYLGRNPFLRADPAGGPPRWQLRSWDAAGAAGLCVLTGLAGVYYAFFSCFLLLMAGLRAASRDRRWKTLAASALLIVLVAGVVGAALSPSLLYMAQHGKNPEVAARLPCEADTYGLGISYLLLPITGHRIGFVAHLVEKFLAAPRTAPGESTSMALGILGAIGFLYLVGRFLWRRGRVERADDGLAYLNITAVLLATIGGFGAVFNFCVSPDIRCYNRISVFIAFFALAGLFLLLQRAAERFAPGRWVRVGWAAGLVALLALGALDQTSPNMIPAYAETRQQLASDEDFGRRIEAALPAGSMVYQMPYIIFPEYPGVEQLQSYELLRPFLHTHTLRWSYAAMSGRETAHWEMELDKLSRPKALKQLAFAGFRGVYIDRAGFADNGAATEASLSDLLGVGPMVSLTGRQTFFDMTPYVRTLRARFSDEEWEKEQDLTLHPFALEWHGAFSVPEESSAEGRWRWCGSEGKLHLVNPSRRARRVVLTMECSGLWDQTTPSRLVVDGDRRHGELSLTAAHQPLEVDLDVPTGDHILYFRCDGRPRQTAEGHSVVFRLWNFEYRVEE